MEKYDKSIGELLQRLVKQVKGHQKETLSLQESEKIVAGQTEEQTMPKTS